MISEHDVKSVIALLPDTSFLITYFAWAHQCTDAPWAYHLGGGLSLLAATAPADLGLAFAGGTLRGNLFTALAGRSGEDRKSHSLSLARDLLGDVAPTLVGTEPATSAGLIDSLAATPTQLVTYSELGVFLADAASGGHKETLKSEYNKAYDCTGIERVKANQNRISVPNPRLSLLAACAVPYLERYTDATDWTGGFMSRWFLLLANRERNLPLGGRSDPFLRGMLQQSLENRMVVPNAGPCLGLDAAARDLWHRWQPDITSREVPAKIAGARVRAPTLALKIALLLGSDHHPEALDGRAWEVGTVDLAPAIAIAELHLKSAISLSDQLSESKDMRDRRAVLQAILGAGRALTFGEVITRSKLLKRRTHEIIDTLTEEGMVIGVSVGGVIAFAAAPSAVALAGTPAVPQNGPAAASDPDAPVSPVLVAPGVVGGPLDANAGMLEPPPWEPHE
jgi:hypothetical protein